MMLLLFFSLSVLLFSFLFFFVLHSSKSVSSSKFDRIESLSHLKIKNRDNLQELMLLLLLFSLSVSVGLSDHLIFSGSLRRLSIDLC